jgi:ribosomal protein L22
VIDHVRGKSVARPAPPAHSPAASPATSSAARLGVANAENNHDLVGDDLLVKESTPTRAPHCAGSGPRAQGRATRIRKRTSHLTVRLSIKE